MLEELLDEALLAQGTRDVQKAERLIHQLAEFPEEALHLAVDALRQPGKSRQALAIRVIHLIGYPKNEPAIAELLYHIGDPNLPGWNEAVETLVDMGPDVVVPHLVQALLEKGPPYHVDVGENQTWAYDVDGICCMLSMRTITSEYALRCCPAINYLLNQADLAQDTDKCPDIDMLLDVVEKAGGQVDYVLPTLIALAKKHHHSDVGERAKTLISAFPPATRATYKLLLTHV
jgi:hypothetical protein